MEIENIIPLNGASSDELYYHTEELAIMTTENPTLLSEDGECYMSDNDDIFGLFIGKDHPLIYKIMEMIENYDENNEVEEDYVIEIE